MSPRIPAPSRDALTLAPAAVLWSMALLTALVLLTRFVSGAAQPLRIGGIATVGLCVAVLGGAALWCAVRSALKQTVSPFVRVLLGLAAASPAAAAMIAVAARGSAAALLSAVLLSAGCLAGGVWLALGLGKSREASRSAEGASDAPGRSESAPMSSDDRTPFEPDAMSGAAARAEAGALGSPFPASHLAALKGAAAAARGAPGAPGAAARHEPRAPEGRVQSGDPLRLSLGDPRNDDAQDVGLPANVRQRWTRASDDGLDVLEGCTRVEFLPGMETAVLHIPVQPPMGGIPTVECEVLDDADVRITPDVVLPFGVRFVCRRSASDAVQSVPVGVRLSSPLAGRGAA